MPKLKRLIDLNLSLAASSLRAWRGTNAFHPVAQQPAQLLQLYDIENCPYCRLVRECLTELDLDALILPCPRGGEVFRPQARERGGKAQFPLLHDPNTKIWLYESADIVSYLRKTYAQVDRPGTWRSMAVFGASLASAARLQHGMWKKTHKTPQQPLELYSFESSPYSRPVRERLCELELPYILRNTGKAAWKDMGPPQLRRRLFPHAPVTGRNRQRLLARAGKVQVPFLIDPNTGTEMFESLDILDYLQRQYG